MVSPSAERKPKISLWIFLAIGYLKEKYACFLLSCAVLLLHADCTPRECERAGRRRARPLRPPPRCSVALSGSTFGVWRLARSQRVHSDSGPAVHFFLCRTVHGPELIPVQNGFTGAGRKRFIAALASLLKMRTNCELRLSQVRETLSRPSHIAAAGCVSACVCLKGSEIDHMIPFVHTHARTHTHAACASADSFLDVLVALQLLRTHWGPPWSPDSRGSTVKQEEIKKNKSTSSTDASCAAGHRAKTSKHGPVQQHGRHFL